MAWRVDEKDVRLNPPKIERRMSIMGIMGIMGIIGIIGIMAGNRTYFNCPTW